MIKSQDLKKLKLPDSPGIYIFKKNKDILYIGKATSLKDRVKSYFNNDLINTRGPLLVKMIYIADKINFIRTDSVLEAIILEANLIKKYQPKYNTLEKDDKSFNYVVITKEEWPRIVMVRGREIEKNLSYKIKETFGPYTDGSLLRSALKIIRKIFPFRDRCLPLSGKQCFNKQIGLCPGVCDGSISKSDYKKIIKNIQLFFEGKKKQILGNLKKEMRSLGKIGEFEKAVLVRNKIFALNHIQDVALIKEETASLKKAQVQALGSSPLLKNKCRPDHLPDQFSALPYRIEAYDVAHLSGTNNVGVMVVMEDGEFKKSDYRKFKIQNSQGNDTGALKEILARRIKHTEWLRPNLIVVDGGLAQFNTARKILQKYQGEPLILLVAVIKDDKHKPKAIIGDKNSINKYKKEILLINNEAHRFAITFHRSKRNVIL